jgi:hypothetical protein
MFCDHIKREIDDSPGMTSPTTSTFEVAQAEQDVSKAHPGSSEIREIRSGLERISQSVRNMRACTEDMEAFVMLVQSFSNELEKKRSSEEHITAGKAKTWVVY